VLVIVAILRSLAVKAIDIAVANYYSRPSLEAALNLLFLHSAQKSRAAHGARFAENRPP
jgi:hypothetical protein